MESTRRQLLITLGVAGALALASCTAGAQTSSPSAGSGTAAPTQAPTSSAVSPTPVDWTTGAPAAGTNAALAWTALMSPDGEYAAAAAYQAVLDRYGSIEPYASILQAELRHSEALVRQLARLGVTAAPNPWIGAIPAPDNLRLAAAAWAAGEVENIAMYDQLLAQVTADPQLTRVLTNLRRASEEVHLPQFRMAAQQGGTLRPDQVEHTP